MNDLISRRAAIEAIREDKIIITPELKPHYDRLGMTSKAADYNAACDKNITLLKLLPPAWQWIPVTERLPEKREWYLGVFREYDTGWVNPLPYICDYIGCRTRATTKDGWILRNCTDDIDGQVSKYFSDLLECVAWMPLPEPYEGGNT